MNSQVFRFSFKISIKHSLLIAFSGLVLHLIILALISFELLEKAGRAQAIQDHFMVLQTQSLQLLKTDANFLNFEMMDTSYFIHGKSKFTESRDSLYNKLLLGINLANERTHSNNSPLLAPLSEVDSLIKCYTVTIDKLTEKIRRRGFRDHGLEGTMRGYVHQLEQIDNSIAPEQLLMLRRHEKDFFLRRDTVYIVKFNALSSRLLESLKEDRRSQALTINLLDLYQKTFNQVAQLEKQIGLTENMGLRKDLYSQGSSIEGSFQALATMSIALAKQKLSSYKLLFFFLFLSSIGLAIGVSIILANKLSLPLRSLTSFVDDCISDGFQNKGPNIKTTSLEISKLTRSFKKLIRKINVQFSEINIKTSEMTAQNEKLLTSEKKFKALVQEGSDLISILDLDANYHFVSESSTFSVLGFTSQDMVGKNICDFIHPEDKGRVSSQFSKLKNKKQTNILPFRFRDANNQWHIISTTATNLINDPAVGGIVANSRDVTESFTQREALKISNERFELAMKATNEMIWDWDIRTDQATRNSGFKNIFGYHDSASNSRQKFWMENIHKEDVYATRKSLIAALKNTKQEKWEKEYRVFKADGKIAYITDHGYIMRDQDGKAVRVVGAVSDITESRKMLAEISHQNKLLREIAWTQSHIVRAPLARLQGLVSLLETDDFDPSVQKELLKNINSSAAELDIIIRDIVNKADQIEK